MPKTEHKEPSFEILRKFVIDRLGTLPALIESDPERARLALANHLPAVVLTPAKQETGPVFDVTGSWNLIPQGDASDAMHVVARDGIEPPTPAFSEPRPLRGI